MLKLSRKRPVEKDSEAEKSKKPGQTKISKFFSNSVLAPAKEKSKERLEPEVTENDAVDQRSDKPSNPPTVVLFTEKICNNSKNVFLLI